MPIGPIVESAVLANPAVLRSSVQAVARARSDAEEAERALQLRADLKMDSTTAARDLADEREVSEHLMRALESPIAHWSGAAIVFLTTEPEHP